MPGEPTVLTVDVAVLAPGGGHGDDWQVLLVRRGRDPYRSTWALPGGKVRPGESADAAARREIAQETGIALERYDLTPLSWYADPGRDPRGRYVSLTYACLLPERPGARAGDDAAEAGWWPVSTAALPPLAFDHGEAVTAVRRLVPRAHAAGLELRRPAQADTAAVIRLHHHALQAAGADAGPGPWDEDLEDISAHYLQPGGEFLVGFLGGFLVAMGALRAAPGGAGEIKRMRVHPRWQGRGFGRRVLEALEERATDLGYRRLVLDTTESQHAALALYRRFGYREAGRGTVAGMLSVFFEKQLLRRSVGFRKLIAPPDAMKERASAPGGCWKLIEHPSPPGKEAHDDGRI
jgi:ADP-ribose pyrophosphatase YjhB (NUDIX family)